MIGPSKNISYSPLETREKQVLDPISPVAKRKSHSAFICCSIFLLLFIFLPIILIFVINFTVIEHESDGDKLPYEKYEEFEYSQYRKDCVLCKSSNEPLTEVKVNSRAPNIVCYYNYPLLNSNTTELQPENITCNLCTHIILAFASVSNSTLKLSDDMVRAIPSLIALKECNKDLKILISAGGGTTNNGFSEMVVNHASRKRFIGSVKSILALYKLDGLDLDWEFPIIPAYKENNKNSQLVKRNDLFDKRQRQHFSQLLREIRMEYIREKRDYILSLAVAAPESIVNIAYDVEEINKYADFINLMAYDFHAYSKYTPFTGMNSPLFNRKDEHFYLSTLNINYTAHLWVNKGMDRNKIIIGLPTFGHTFALVNSNNVYPGSPANGFGKTGENGFIKCWEVCELINKSQSSKVFFDNETLSPYLVSGSDWISYENMESIIFKTNFIKDNNFGGAMIFSLNSDDYLGKCSKDNRFYLTSLVRNTLIDDDL